MKKQILMVAAVALALGGCSKTETTGAAQGGVIGFAGSGIDNITKAGDLATSDNSFNKFYVYGGYQIGENQTVQRFTAQEVTNSEGTWSYTPAQYWVNGTWAFGAYATSATASNVSDITWDYSKGLEFTVNSGNSSQGDVVYAGVENISVDDATAYSTAVSLAFKHLLSKIQFKFTLGSSVSAYTVNLSGFKVYGMVTDGTWTKGALALGQTKADSESAYTDFATEETVGNGLVAGPFYVIPQEVKENADAFQITFNAVVTDGTTKYKNGTVTAVVPKDASYGNWEAQKYYQYSAVIEMDNIQDEDQTEDPKPIKFSVSQLETWQETPTNIDTELNDVQP